jgi:hypothetical protein
MRKPCSDLRQHLDFRERLIYFWEDMQIIVLPTMRATEGKGFLSLAKTVDAGT